MRSRPGGSIGYMTVIVFNGDMRVLLQRVSQASVMVDGGVLGQIGAGLVIFVGVGREDTRAAAERTAQKVVQLRVFPDESGKMNRSLWEARGELLIVSQFTLYADARKGNRPSYSQAAPPEQAQALYEYFVELCQKRGFRVETGIFQAQMQVHLVNDGPVTILYDSES
jgi:D-aminoacyl-tRNA deacylase